MALKKNLSESPESLNGDFIYIYFSADKPPTEEIPSEAPLCYKFKVKSIEAQLLKIKKNILSYTITRLRRVLIIQKYLQQNAMMLMAMLLAITTQQAHQYATPIPKINLIIP